MILIGAMQPTSTALQNYYNTMEVWPYYFYLSCFFSGPERHLFLFSLLQLQEQSMEFYWKESVGGTGSALLACRYLRAIAHHSELDDEPEEQKRLLQLAT